MADLLTDDQIEQWCQAKGTSPQRLLSRERVMGVPCPRCFADRDEHCLKARGGVPRASNHIGRVFNALRAFYTFD